MIEDSRNSERPSVSGGLSRVDGLEGESLKDAHHVDLKLSSGEDGLVKHACLDKEGDGVFGGEDVWRSPGGRGQRGRR